MRDEILSAYRAALASVDPQRATRSALERRPPRPGGIWVAALGKAAPAMTRGAVEAVGDRFSGGLAVSDHPEALPDGCTLLLGSHPRPDGRSLTAGRALTSFVAEVPRTDTLLVLISGGGSALAEVPAPGLGVETLADLIDDLMATGTPIDDLNVVRRHLSRLKNGGLGASTQAAHLITLLISDVVDAPASTIASGPTLPDHTGPGDAAEIVRHRLKRELPDIAFAVAAEHGDHHWEVVADCRIAAAAAAASIDGRIWTDALRGDARSMALEMVQACQPGEVLVAAGETTVTVTGPGTGGRNQEAALVAAIAIADSDIEFAALGTDGIDGPTDAAGAIVDGASTARMHAAGVDPEGRLGDNDSNRALAASGDLVFTGPTGTNVGDLWFVVR